MGSLVPGYEYDIFISYRQKDNKYDGWVTEFVDNLKRELEATFKEDLTVYFDINPHDGLLETHDVDASLREKLKCLVFIPVLSRTYCDPNSFAWEHEFKSFIEQASVDKYGLKIKLPNGNVVSRLLPVLIHDLDRNDKELCESILGGVLRGIEFIYKEAGVNRPLKPDDDTTISLNKTKYRNQLNKVALAVKEIFSGLNADSGILADKKSEMKQEIRAHKNGNSGQELQRSVKRLPVKAWAGVVIIAGLIFAVIIARPDLFKRNAIESLRLSGERISVAVMPFQNMTNDTTKNFWQEMIQDNLITSLSNSEELKVRQTESIITLLQNNNLVNYGSISPSVAGRISQKLNASVFVQGSINQVGSIIRLNAKLIDSETEEVLKSIQLDGTTENILYMVDSLSRLVNNFLILTSLKKVTSPDLKNFVSTSSPEAYRYYIYGRNAFYKRDYTSALNWFSQTIAIDSAFTSATVMICLTYSSLGMNNQARIHALRPYNKRDELPVQQKVIANWLYAVYYETYQEENKYLIQYLEFDDLAPPLYYMLGLNYNGLQQYDRAIPEFEKALDIYNNWGMKPPWVSNYTNLGLAYHKTGKYREEKNLYKKAEQNFPDDPFLIYRQAIISLSEGDSVTANRNIKKYISLRKEGLASQATITTNLAFIYTESEKLDKAEEYFREALTLEPEKSVRINNLALFLIEKDRNINEGMDLIEKALKLSPDNYLYLDTKGLGLFKQGKYKEAVDLLEKSWSMKPIYNHEIYLHLQAAINAFQGTNDKDLQDKER